MFYDDWRIAIYHNKHIMVKIKKMVLKLRLATWMQLSIALALTLGFQFKRAKQSEYKTFTDFTIFFNEN